MGIIAYNLAFEICLKLLFQVACFNLGNFVHYFPEVSNKVFCFIQCAFRQYYFLENNYFFKAHAKILATNVSTLYQCGIFGLQIFSLNTLIFT
jgi:hypothetical protein